MHMRRFCRLYAPETHSWAFLAAVLPPYQKQLFRAISGASLAPDWGAVQAAKSAVYSGTVLTHPYRLRSNFRTLFWFTVGTIIRICVGCFVMLLDLGRLVFHSHKPTCPVMYFGAGFRKKIGTSISRRRTFSGRIPVKILTHLTHKNIYRK